jgi:hypothetical protein
MSLKDLYERWTELKIIPVLFPEMKEDTRLKIRLMIVVLEFIILVLAVYVMWQMYQYRNGFIAGLADAKNFYQMTEKPCYLIVNKTGV